MVGAAAALIVLALFRWIEARLPSEFYAHHSLRFARERVMAERDVRQMIGKHGFSVANLSSRLTEGGQHFEYRMTIKSRDRDAAEALSKHLLGLPDVVEFRITPTGDGSGYFYSDLGGINCPNDGREIAARSRIINSKKPANTATTAGPNIMSSVIGSRCPKLLRCGREVLLPVNTYFI